MKVSYAKKAISFMIALIMTASLFSINLDALSSAEEVQTGLWSQKISDDLWNEMDSSDEDDKISVWIWFSDIDQDEVEQRVKQETGLDYDEIDVDFQSVPDELIEALDNASVNSEDELKNQALVDKLDEYISSTDSARQKEYNNTYNFLYERRQIASEMYIHNNNSLIQSLDLPEDEIIFNSQLTPSLIINLNKTQICQAANSSDVISIDYFEEPEFCVEPNDIENPASNTESLTQKIPPRCDNAKKTMRVAKVQEEYGLTGEGVNIAMPDAGYIDNGATQYESFNPQRVTKVCDKALCSIKDSESGSSHPNLIASEIQEYSPDVNIFSVGGSAFEDLEWAVKYCNINIINLSLEYKYFAYYINDTYTKWFDALVNTYNVTLIASAGNYRDTKEGAYNNGYYVICPARGYNSIAVGAYITDGNSENDIMHDFRYSGTNSSDLVSYKPDMVVAADSTSEAASALSGIVSMLIQVKPSLAAQPELIKAILMSSCHRKVLPAEGTGTQELITDGLTERQGSGAVDAYRAIKIVLQGSYGIGEITSGYVDSDSIQIDGGHNVNVSLSWFRENINRGKNPIDGTDEGTLQELELGVYQEFDLIANSDRLNAGKQMAYFTTTSSDNKYNIRVTKKTENDKPVRYAYAWSTEDNYIVLHHGDDPDISGTITQEEVAEQLSAAGIDTVNIDTPFSVAFDETVSYIGDNALDGYHNLANVKISNCIHGIGKYAFKDCTLLERIDIPTGLFTIEEGAFQNCNKLTDAVIGDSVRSIETKAFYQCSRLQNVEFKKYVAPTIEVGAFLNVARNATAKIPLHAVGYADYYDNLQIIRERDMRTIYFTNNRNWDSVYVYMYNSGFPSYNKTVEMEYTYTNYLNEPIYSVTFDYNEYDVIKFKDVYNIGVSTVDINVGDDGTGYYLTTAKDYSSWKVGTYNPDVRTIYFTNVGNWSDVRAYLWKSGTTQDNLWHGAPMTYVETNSDGQDIYSITLDYKEFDCVVFNDYNSSEQTVDIGIGASGICYYLLGNKTGNKYSVGSYMYK